MRINVDMDGVLADFDGYYAHWFGDRPTRWPDPETVDWDKVRSVPQFFSAMPMIEDAPALIQGVVETGLPWRVLTGVPGSINKCDNDKVEWIRDRFKPTPEVLCCRSREKCLHCEPGDVLIDDYTKYRDLWLNAGGIFIVHRTASDSLAQLQKVIRALA